MQYRNVYQIYWDTNLDKLYDSVKVLIQKFFEKKNYGNLVEIVLTGISCTISKDVRKTKPKYYKKDQLLEFHIIIDYNTYQSLNETEKKKCIATAILGEVEAVSLLKLKNFDEVKFKNDFEMCFQNLGWLEIG